MRFRIKDLKNYIQGEINWKKVADDLNLKSFEAILHKEIIDVDFLANRYPDSASLIGLSKEIEAISNYKAKIPKIANKSQKSNISINNYVRLKIQTPKVLYYFGRVILDVKNQKSPKWLQGFVEFYGFNSVNLLVDLSNFVMIETGAPLHIFDLDKIEGDFVLREAKEGEIFHSLTDKQFSLPDGAVIVENKGEIVDLVSIWGGEAAKTELKTKNILIQAPIIEPTTIYSTSRIIGFQTDASYRFERGIPPINSKMAVERITELISSMTGGKVVFEKLEIGKLPQPQKIILHLQKIKEYSGLEFNAFQVAATLKKLNCLIIKQTNKFIYAETPSRRLDINCEEDLIEEIIRISGWDKIKSSLPKTQLIGRTDDSLELKDLSRKIMTSAGFDEVVNYNFVSEDESAFFGVEPVKVLNPINKNFSFYRPFIFINLIKSAKSNFNLFKEIKIFEIGKCAELINKKIIEKNKLGFLISLSNSQSALLEAGGLTRVFFEKLGMEAHIKNTHLDIFESSASVHLDNETAIGFVGMLDKEMTKFYDLDQKVVVGEFDIDLILKNLKSEIAYNPIPEFPAIVRDISLIIPETTQIDYLENDIQYLGGDILESVNLFDVYRLDDLPNKKSIAFRLVFRAKDKSLRDEEVNKIMQKIANSLVDKFGVGIR